MANFHFHHLLHKLYISAQTIDGLVVGDSALEEAKCLMDTPRMKYKGFLLRPDFGKACQVMEKQYNPLSSDIILTSFPKTGTTWPKALVISIINNHKNSKLQNHNSSDPLSTHNPLELVPFLEGGTFSENPYIDINQTPSPRVFNTHLAYFILPKQIKTSSCKIVYISRNPWDTFVSSWHFFDMNFSVRTILDVACNDFYEGLVPTSPYFDHILEFWQVRDKDDVFFITYEDLKEGPHNHVKELAEFLNFSLSNDEVEEVATNYTIKRLKKAEENGDESARIHWGSVKFDSFYHKGVVGDWKNHLSRGIVQRILGIWKQKWNGTNLEFKLLSGGHNLELS